MPPPATATYTVLPDGSDGSTAIVETRAEFAVSFRVEPATEHQPLRFSARIEGFDPGPRARVYSINEDESKAFEKQLNDTEHTENAKIAEEYKGVLCSMAALVAATTT